MTLLEKSTFFTYINENCQNVLDFCNEFTFYDQNNNDRVLELNYFRVYKINTLSESDFKHEDNRIKVISTIDVNSLKIIDRGFKLLSMK